MPQTHSTYLHIYGILLVRHENQSHKLISEKITIPPTSLHGNSMTRFHNSDVMMGIVASQITSLTTVYSTIYSGGYHGKHQSSMSQAFVQGIHWWPVNSLHKWPVSRKIFPFDNVITSWPLRLGHGYVLAWLKVIGLFFSFIFPWLILREMFDFWRDER